MVTAAGACGLPAALAWLLVTVHAVGVAFSRLRLNRCQAAGAVRLCALGPCGYESTKVDVQAKLVVRVLPLASVGGAKDALQQLRLSVTCAPSTKRSPVAPSLRQDAVSYGGTYSTFGRWDD